MSADDLIRHYAFPLRLPWSVVQAACRVRDQCQVHVEGRSLETVAGGCVLLACDAGHYDTVTREQVSIVAGVAESTLVGFCRQVRRALGDVIL